MTVRSVWTGTISFGMVVIPVRLGTAVSEDDNPELHQVRRSDGSRIGYRRFAKADGAEVAYADVAKGYELGDGRVVVLEDSDFEKAYGPKSREAKVIATTPVSALPRAAHEAAYYVEPAKGGEKAYALLEQALTATGRAAVVLFAMRQREAQGLLYPVGEGRLALERLHWAAQVKEPDFTVAAPELSQAEREMALNLVAAMPQDFNWAAQADTGAAALEAVVQAKIGTGQVTGAPAPAQLGAATRPQDLMAVLAASVEQARKAKAPVRKPRAGKAAAVREAA